MDSGITAWIFVPYIPLPEIRLPISARTWKQANCGEKARRSFTFPFAPSRETSTPEMDEESGAPKPVT
jgi:hypothetical protein